MYFNGYRSQRVLRVLTLMFGEEGNYKQTACQGICSVPGMPVRRQDNRLDRMSFKQLDLRGSGVTPPPPPRQDICRACWEAQDKPAVSALV